MFLDRHACDVCADEHFLVGFFLVWYPIWKTGQRLLIAALRRSTMRLGIDRSHALGEALAQDFEEKGGRDETIKNHGQSCQQKAEYQ